MRLLYIHSDFMEFETKKKTKFAEEITEATRKNRVEDALVNSHPLRRRMKEPKRR